ncbi:MAG: outer membrane beta-barrel protein [bacterium]
MMRRSSMAAAALMTLLLGPTTARLHAQLPISVGLGGGTSLPLGSFGDDVSPGWRALGTLGLEVPIIPIGVRLDAAYDRFSVNRALVGASGSPSGSRRVASFTVNATYRLLPLPLLTPYLIAGGGSYNVGCGGGVSCQSQTSFGWNGGAGLKFGALGIHAFAEARYHHVNVSGTSVQFVPVTVGLMF